ncbi:hypothetical protein EV363DRAFT_1297741 [Boletus edulis]|nr:hypothetical protein EV363DRAFT_1297741 [Boletus edulis]
MVLNQRLCCLPWEIRTPGRGRGGGGGGMDNADEKVLKMEEEEESEDEPPPFPIVLEMMEEEKEEEKVMEEGWWWWNGTKWTMQKKKSLEWKKKRKVRMNHLQCTNFNEILITMYHIIDEMAIQIQFSDMHFYICLYHSEEQKAEPESFSAYLALKKKNSKAIIILSKDISTEIHGGHPVQGSTWDFEKTERSSPELLEYPDSDFQPKDFLRTLSRQKATAVSFLSATIISMSGLQGSSLERSEYPDPETIQSKDLLKMLRRQKVTVVSFLSSTTTESSSERYFGSRHSQEVEVKTSIQQKSSHEHDHKESASDLI